MRKGNPAFGRLRAPMREELPADKVTRPEWVAPTVAGEGSDAECGRAASTTCRNVAANHGSRSEPWATDRSPLRIRSEGGTAVGWGTVTKEVSAVPLQGEETFGS